VILLVYFTSREVAASSIFAALWVVLNLTLNPLIMSITRGYGPVFCDIAGFTSLMLVTWWTRKLGVATVTGVVATILTLIFRPIALWFFGFAVAGVFFDVMSKTVGYNVLFGESKRSVLILVALSTLSGAIAGVLIGASIGSGIIISPVVPQARVATLGGLLLFAGLHTGGGLLSGIIGILLINILKTRIVPPEQ
jgi:hypothetical protein